MDALPPAPPAALDVEALADVIAERVRRAVLAEAAPEPLLDLAGVARWLNVSERTVESFVATGELPCLRIGMGRGVRRFETAAVEAFIRRQASGGRRGAGR